ncbi:hypothetical protein F0562_013677 [Nyssa sinensis]|uniref:Retrovirus-related Pol polyprotein from transposon TNT 1-94-like beta-barrel domain-containing protein n=1 Tax=Nyssa sinensis TaxID=561372 RepID=A0A5J4ZP53_9ASTE|nr:hypothetical protein F0562_013677 [Nyssa sinensis]
MEGEFNFSSVAPPVFDGDNYQMWAVRMETYLDALDLWEAVEEDYEVQPLPANPTVAQIKIYKEKRARKSKVKACLFAAVSPTIFTRIMSLKSAKDIWDYLKEEYAGDERIKGIQVLNLIKEFELQRMKDSKTIKDYSNRLLSIANKVRLLGSGFTDSRIVEKILVTVPERYEATITTLENTKDLSKISLAELLNALQAPEERDNHHIQQCRPKENSDVLYVPEIDQNLLSVGQLIKKGFKVIFEDSFCYIFDITGQEILRVRMKGKSFSFDPIKEEPVAFPTETSNTEI